MWCDAISTWLRVVTTWCFFLCLGCCPKRYYYIVYRIQDLEAHSKTCSSPQSSPARGRSKKISAPRYGGIHQSYLHVWRTVSVSLSPNTSPTKQHGMGTPPKQDGLGTDHLVVSVTRSPPGTTDLSPFKIITKVMSKLGLSKPPGGGGDLRCARNLFLV